MADSSSSSSSGKGSVPVLALPAVPNGDRLPSVPTLAPRPAQESSVKGGDNSSKETVEDQKEETKGPINFWAFESILYCHPPPPLNRFLSVRELEERQRYRDPLEWMYPDEDDFVEDWLAWSEEMDSD